MCKEASDALTFEYNPDQRAELDRHFSAGRPSERAGNLGGPTALGRRIARLQKGVCAEQRCRPTYAGHQPRHPAGDFTFETFFYLEPKCLLINKP